MKLKLKSILLLALVCMFALPSFSQGEDSKLTSDVFVNMNAKGIEEGAKFTWALDYDNVDKVQNVIIKYQKKIEKGKPWKYSPVIDGKSTSFSLNGILDFASFISSFC